jgi:hypothetical protein
MILKTNHEIVTSLFELRADLLKDLSTQTNRELLHQLNKIIYEDYPVCKTFYNAILSDKD